MKLYLAGHSARYAIEQLQLSLFPDEPVTVVETPPAPEEDGAVSALHVSAVWLTAVTTMTRGGERFRVERRMRATEDERLRRRLLQNCYYDCALHFLPQAPAWGALSGVRPTKLATAALLEGKSEAETARELSRVYRVSPERAALTAACGAASVRALEKTTPEELSLYVGIPFCPTRCVYCSFISRPCDPGEPLVDNYLDALLDEIAYTGLLLRHSGRRVRTVYFGGGTPTTLSTAQLSRLMDGLAEAIDLSRCHRVHRGGRAARHPRPDQAGHPPAQGRGARQRQPPEHERPGAGAGRRRTPPPWSSRPWRRPGPRASAS